MIGKESRGTETERQRPIGRICGAALAVLIVFVLLLSGSGGERGVERMKRLLFGNGERIVGTQIEESEITEFFYTCSKSTNPPSYLRYRFYTQDGAHRFFHETRGGDHWPLTEADVTASGEKALSQEEWSAFFDTLRGGRVKKRAPSAESGDPGPWLYLYWKGDRGMIQEFSFASREARADFEALCIALRDAS